MSSNKKSEENIFNWGFVVIIALFVSSLLIPYTMGLITNYKVFLESLALSNIFFTGLTTLLLIFTIRQQREEIRIARDANELSHQELVTSNSRFAEQTKVLEFQRFETTFFNLLSRLENSLTGFGKGKISSSKSLINERLRTANDQQELQDKYNVTEENKTALSEFLNMSYGQYFTIFESILTRINKDITDRNDRKKYYEILSSTIDYELRYILFYEINLRPNGKPDFYFDFSEILFKDITPIWKHIELLPIKKSV